MKPSKEAKPTKEKNLEPPKKRVPKDPLKERKQLYKGIDFAAEGKQLLQPIEETSTEILDWDTVVRLANDDSLVHGDANSYTEFPSEGSIYIIRNFVCTPENIAQFRTRDNLVCKMGGTQTKDNMKRYKYLTKLEGAPDYGTDDIRKYIFSVPDKNTLVIHYWGNPHLVQRHLIAPTRETITKDDERCQNNVSRKKEGMR